VIIIAFSRAKALAPKQVCLMNKSTRASCYAAEMVQGYQNHATQNSHDGAQI
jgi:hypothetical protein